MGTVRDFFITINQALFEGWIVFTIMTNSPSSPALPSTFKETLCDEDGEYRKSKICRDSTSPVAPEEKGSPSTLEPLGGLLGIRKEEKSQKRRDAPISWRHTKYLAHKSSTANSLATSQSKFIAQLNGNGNHHPMAPPLKKRLGAMSSGAYGQFDDSSQDTVNWTMPSTSKNHPGRTPAVKAAKATAARVAMQTPQIRIRGTAGSQLFQSLASVGTGHKLMSQPLINTPHPSLYYSNLAGNSARSLRVPSSLTQNRSKLNFDAIDREETPSFQNTAKNKLQIPISAVRTSSRKGTVTFQDDFKHEAQSFSAWGGQVEQSGQKASILPYRPSSRNANISFQNAIRASFPFQDEVQGPVPQVQGPVPQANCSDPTIAPISLTETLTNTTATQEQTSAASDSHGSRNPTETGNLSVPSNANVILQLYKAPPSNTAHSLCGSSSPPLKYAPTAIKHFNKKEMGAGEDTTVMNKLIVTGNAMPSTRAATPSGASSYPANRVALSTLFGVTNTHSYNLGCTCKSSKCLKLYCKCFQGGKYCDDSICRCNACHNSSQYDGPDGVRRNVIWQTLARRPDAFAKRPTKKTGEGCACKKTQ